VTVEQLSSQNLDLIRDLQSLVRRSKRSTPTPRARLHELASRRIHAPDEILEWAKRDRRWSFMLAEMLSEPMSRPRDLAARLILAIIDELEEEQESLAGEMLDGAEDAVPIHAE
jgi:hypothetical protein